MYPIEAHVVDLDVLAGGNVNPAAAVLASYCCQRSHLMRKKRTRGEAHSKHEGAILSLLIDALRTAE